MTKNHAPSKARNGAKSVLLTIFPQPMHRLIVMVALQLAAGGGLSAILIQDAVANSVNTPEQLQEYRYLCTSRYLPGVRGPDCEISCQLEGTNDPARTFSLNADTPNECETLGGDLLTTLTNSLCDIPRLLGKPCQVASPNVG